MEKVQFLICLLTLSIVWCTEIRIVCEDSEMGNSADCTFTESGTYVLEGISENTHVVRFDRLTNSKVLLPANVNHLIIKSSRFDSLTPCAHIIAPASVTVSLEDIESTTRCVSINPSINKKKPNTI